MAARRSSYVPLLGIILISAAMLAFVFVKDWRPQLGLDLQGGASVVYESGTEVDDLDSALDTAIEIIRSRVDALGVAEPEIVRQGDAIVVNLPGVEDQDRALQVIGRTAELRFRPVLAACSLDANGIQGCTQAETLLAAGSTGTIDPATASVGPGGVVDAGDPTATTAPADPAATTAPVDPSATTATATATTATTAPATATTEGALGYVEGENAGPATPAVGRQEPTTTTATTVADETTTTVAGETTTTVAGDPAATTTTVATGDTSSTTSTSAGPPECGDGVDNDGDGGTDFEPSGGAQADSGCFSADGSETDACELLGGATTPEADVPEAQVLVPEQDSDGKVIRCYVLAPVPTSDDGQQLVGAAVSGPEASINGGEWGVNFGIRGEYRALFNRVASQCYNGDPTACPTRQLAIVLDSRVQSAPVFQIPEVGEQGLTISGSFGERGARDLALVLRFGALPIELERVNFETVSPTLGEDSLRAGLVAGLIGVVVVALYMLIYYRALGMVVILGLVVWSGLIYAIVCYLSEKQGLALSLAGVTGLVVSVGVAVDSYVVFFERLKDEVRSGKTLRSSVDRGFKRAFRTILAANATSFIGAFLLYVLTVGAVRGFAFMLGLSTILDVVVAYYFTRPLVALLGRSEFFTRSRRFGVARGSRIPGQDQATGPIAPIGGGR